jgi:hypothetical protein
LRAGLVVVLAASTAAIFSVVGPASAGPGAPGFAWASAVGSSGANEVVRAVDTTDDGDVLITGSFVGEVAVSGADLRSAGALDMLVARYDPAGGLRWAHRFGSTADDVAYDVAAAGDGAVICGTFQGSVDFGGTTLTGSSRRSNHFVVHLDEAGDVLWARGAVARGGGVIAGECVALPDGRVVVAGSFSGSASWGPLTRSSTGALDTYAVSYSADGNEAWVSVITGAGDQRGRGVEPATDGSGDVFVTGLFTGDLVTGTATPASAGASDIFVTRISSDGSTLWTRTAGGPGEDYGRAVAATPGGDVVVAGSFTDTARLGRPPADLPGRPGRLRRHAGR